MRDFVELPSQVMENWCYDPDALKLFAKHYQTGEVIPNELIEKIRDSQTFLAGLANLRQLRFGFIGAENTLKPAQSLAEIAA